VGTIRDYKDLIVWQRAGELELCCHELLSRLSGPARREIGAQIRRAANSVGANIAEGHSRPGRGEYLQFIGYARASVKELESHLLSLERLGHASGPRVNRALSLCEECSKMLAVLRRRLRERGA
jgi:four helix bundle protein